MRTSSRNFAVLLFDEVELLDVAAVMHVAAAAGRHWNWRPFRMLPTAVDPGLVATRSQLRLEAALPLAACPAPEILLVPGGYGARVAARDPRVLAFVAASARSAELTLGIGAGVAVLGAAGALEGARVAVSAENREWLVHDLPSLQCDEREPLVTSGKLLTAAETSHALELAFAVVARCLGVRFEAQLRQRLGMPATPKRIELGSAPHIPLPKR